MSEHAAPTTAPAIVIDAARPGSATTKPAQPVALNLSIASIAKSAPIQSPAPAQDVVVGGYRLGKTIGEGTYGKVKIAYDVRTNEKFAIKLLEKANIKSEKQVKRLQREIRFLKLLHHPHIVKVYDVMESKDLIYIVMEWASGGELFDYIVAHKRVKEKEAREFFRQILSAMDYCHKNAVIHRDMKPENLLLDADKTIKIIDFGFANTYKSDGLMDTFCGSPFYAAPEMILGRRYEGPEVDLWSLGVILFALICGHLPFDDEDTRVLYRKISSASYVMPAHVPTDCRDLIQRMICVDPKQRATLTEVMNHRWTMEGFSAPPESFLPPRPVLTAAQLDADVLTRLETFGYAMKDIQSAFDTHARQMKESGGKALSSKIEPVIPTYHLLVEMLKRERERQRVRQATIDAPKQPEGAAAVSPTSPAPRTAPTVVLKSKVIASANELSVESRVPEATTAIGASQNNIASVKTRAAKDAFASLPGGLNMAPTGPQPLSDDDEARQRSRSTNVAKNALSVKTDTTHARAHTTDASVDAASPTSSDEPQSPARRMSAQIIKLWKRTTGSPQSPPSPGPTSPQLAAPQSPLRSPPKTPTSGGSEARTVSSWFMNVATTSSKSPAELRDMVVRVLRSLEKSGVRYEQDRHAQWVVLCEVNVDAFLEYAKNNGLDGSTSMRSLNGTAEGTVSPFASPKKHASTSPLRNVSTGDTKGGQAAQIHTHNDDGSTDMTDELQDMDMEEDETDSVTGSVSSAVAQRTGMRSDMVTFQIEVCKVPRLNLHGLHFKRIAGGVWSYKKVYTRLSPLFSL